MEKGIRAPTFNAFLEMFCHSDGKITKTLAWASFPLVRAAGHFLLTSTAQVSVASAVLASSLLITARGEFSHSSSAEL